MAKDQTRRNSPQLLQEDKDSHDGIKGIADYDPSNPDFAKDKLQAARDAMETAQAAEVNAEAAAKAARDAANAKEWAFHNAILGAKQQVVAQYTDDSDEASAVGLKKKSEYKKPTSNGKTVTTPTQ